MQVFFMQGGSLLAVSNYDSGISATISGYEADNETDEEESGFKQ